MCSEGNLNRVKALLRRAEDANESLIMGEIDIKEAYSTVYDALEILAALWQGHCLVRKENADRGP